MELSTLEIEPGYFRFDAMSTRVYECTNGNAKDSACVGGNGTGSQLCGTGYTGALCSRCESNYYRREAYDTCAEHSAQAFFEPSLQALILVIILLALAFFFCLAELKSAYERMHWDKLRVGYINYVLDPPFDSGSAGRRIP